MQAKKTFDTRRMVQMAVLAGLVGTSALLPAMAAAPDGVAIDQVEAQARASWRDNMAHTAPPAEGCFHAAYPSILWERASCVAALRAHPVPRRIVKGREQTVGDGADYAAQVPGLISQTVGSFPTIIGVTSEQGVNVPFGGGESNGITGPNEYTLQLNSNANGTTAACNGHSGCVVWQQAVYGPSLSNNGGGAVFFQYWLIGYGGSGCPSGYISDGGGDCYMNSAAANVPNLPITELANMKLSFAAVFGGNDTVVLTDGAQAYTASGRDSVLDIASVWHASEFNVVGNAGGSQAQFNNGSTLVVNVAVTDGSTAAPSCASNAGTTGETNNLNLYSCTPTSGSTPSIQFTESNATVSTVTATPNPVTIPAGQTTAPVTITSNAPGYNSLSWYGSNSLPPYNGEILCLGSNLPTTYTFNGHMSPGQISKLYLVPNDNCTGGAVVGSVPGTVLASVTITTQ